MGLREIRNNRKLSQWELADMSGVNFRADVLLRLTTVLGCSAEELIAGDALQVSPYARKTVCPLCRFKRNGSIVHTTEPQDGGSVQTVRFAFCWTITENL